MSKFMICHPGASTSTHDVFIGLTTALRAAGVPLAEFRLDGRINRVHQFLHFLWRKQRKQQRDEAWPKPTAADVLYQAACGLVERALARQCDAILIVSAMFLQPDILVLARRAHLKTYLLCTESPYDISEEKRIAGLVDGVWTNDRAAVPVLRDACACVSYLPHAWLPGVHDCTTPTVEPAILAHDVIYVGTYFEERRQLLEAVDWSGIDLGLYGSTERIPKRSPLLAFVRGGRIQNSTTVALYRHSQIGMNLYRRSTQGRRPVCEAIVPESLNPRAYELAAAGVCSVSELRPEVREKFGSAVPTFETPAELEKLIRELLADPARRATLGAAARAAVSEDTWHTRVNQMLRDLSAWEGTTPATHLLMRSA